MSNRCVVLEQDLVVLGHGRHEDEGVDALEAVDPLFALRPLSAHVEYPFLLNIF